MVNFEILRFNDRKCEIPTAWGLIKISSMAQIKNLSTGSEIAALVILSRDAPVEKVPIGNRSTRGV